MWPRRMLRDVEREGEREQRPLFVRECVSPSAVALRVRVRTARWAARQKLINMVAGVHLVRKSSAAE